MTHPHPLVLPFLLAVLCSGALCACGSRGSNAAPVEQAPMTGTVGEGPEESEVLRIYNLYLKGLYEQYVQEMASCDGKPVAYRQQMVDLYEQHAAQQLSKNGGAIQATVVRIEPTPDGRQSNVFLRILYNNHSHEVVMISLVKVDGRWRLP